MFAQLHTPLPPTNKKKSSLHSCLHTPTRTLPPMDEEDVAHAEAERVLDVILDWLDTEANPRATRSTPTTTLIRVHLLLWLVRPSQPDETLAGMAKRNGLPLSGVRKAMRLFKTRFPGFRSEYTMPKNRTETGLGRAVRRHGYMD